MMSGSNGTCSFIKQERIEGDGASLDVRTGREIGVGMLKSGGPSLNNDICTTDKVPLTSPSYIKGVDKSAGQLPQEQPDSQSSNNNNSLKNGELFFIFYRLV